MVCANLENPESHRIHIEPPFLLDALRFFPKVKSDEKYYLRHSIRDAGLERSNAKLTCLSLVMIVLHVLHVLANTTWQVEFHHQTSPPIANKSIIPKAQQN